MKNIVPGFLLGIFSGEAKSIVMQISFVMLLFSDQISGRGKSFQGGQTASGGANCLRGGAPPVEESQVRVITNMVLNTLDS